MVPVTTNQKSYHIPYCIHNYWMSYIPIIGKLTTIFNGKLTIFVESHQKSP